MPTIMVSVEGVTVKPQGGKPKLLLRGARRTKAQRLYKALQVLENKDYAEKLKGEKNKYTPFLILGASNSQWAAALAKLKMRLADCLAAKV